jgi:spermidine synthase
VTPQEKIRRLSSRDGELLHSEKTHDQIIEVRADDTLRWLHFGGTAVQSVMDMDTPHLPLQPYNVAMLAALLFQPRPRRLLNLGFGGGTFERCFRARLPATALTSVEADAAVIQLAKRFFLIPPDYPVIHARAEQFLARDRRRYDIIFCDIFHAYHHPACLFDSRFHAAAARRLSAAGVFVVNLLPATEAGLLEILVAIRQHFQWTLLAEIPGQRNVLLFGLQQAVAETAVYPQAAMALAKEWGVDLTAIPTRFKHLPRQPLWM